MPGLNSKQREQVQVWIKKQREYLAKKKKQSKGTAGEKVIELVLNEVQANLSEMNFNFQRVLIDASKKALQFGFAAEYNQLMQKHDRFFQSIPKFLNANRQSFQIIERQGFTPSHSASSRSPQQLPSSSKSSPQSPSQESRSFSRTVKQAAKERKEKQASRSPDKRPIKLPPTLEEMADKRKKKPS